MGIHDHFLDLGGDSLTLDRVPARHPALLGRALSIVSLFDLATVEEGGEAGGRRGRAAGSILTPSTARSRAGRREGSMAVGEAPIKQAIKWIDEQLQTNPGASRVKLVDEAGRRFDLTPLDADFLLRHFAERKAP